MNKKLIICFSLLAILVAVGGITLFSLKLRKDNTDTDASKKKTENTIAAMVIEVDDDTLTIQDSDHIIYILNVTNNNLRPGNNIEISYKGTLDKNKSLQNIDVLDYKTIDINNNEYFPSEWQDNGIFKDYSI